MRGLRGGKTEECRGELIARERRGELSGPDCIALRAHLAECQSCCLARQVFVDFEHMSGVDLHDGSRIERLSMAARRWGQQSSSSRRHPGARLWRRAWAVPLRTLAFAAIVLLIGGTASATMWWFRRPQQAVKATVDSVERPVAPARRKTARTRSLATANSSAGETSAAENFVADDSLSPSSAEPSLAPSPAGERLIFGPELAPGSLASATPASRVWRRPERRAATERRVANAVANAVDRMASPSGLLRQASDARRSGDAERAIGLYRRLQRDFPRSSEATLSAVSLGGLLLDRRLPRAALTQFDGYLVTSRGGVLIPEALYGRGRALASLGDRQEERRTWDRLLNDFPDSAYGPFAKRRLQELR